MFRNPWVRALVILLLAGVLGLYAATQNSELPSWITKTCPAPNAEDGGATRWLKERCMNLGLDLAGGTQLRYRIDLSQVDVAQRQQIIDGIRNIIDKRVNNLGVSEPIVTPSTLNGQSYITVELPGTKDIQSAIDRVGKTVLLEFKEQRETLTEEEQKADEAYNAAKKTLATTVRERAKTEDFDALTKEVSEQNFVGRGGLFKDKFKEDVFEDLQPVLFEKLKPGEVSDVLEVTQKKTGADATTTTDVVVGYSIVKLESSTNVEKKIQEQAKATVTHLLVAYAGASNVDPAITRTKDEAKKLAEDYLAQINDKKAELPALIQANSDDPSKTSNKGTFADMPVGDPDPTKNAFVKEFNDAIVAAKVGDLVGPVETAFGYHLIRVDAKTDKIDETQSRPQVTFHELFFTTRYADGWRETGLTGKQFKLAVAQPVANSLAGYEVSIKFSDEGAKLFGEITKRNIQKPVAIFLDGELISQPTVQNEITSGEAVITGGFSAQTASELAKNLNTGALPAPIQLVDQRQVEATLGSVALADSLTGGLYGLLVLALFMILYYRLPGFIATLALALYALLLLALFRLFPGYTLTLAGIAGNILAVGMAVDANILIFERMREELHAGKSLELAIEQGFRRAWSSIRDSNVSSLITAGILTMIGTSVIRGFALTLALGILVSLFTAIWVTRGLLLIAMRTSLAKFHWLWVPWKPSARHFAFLRARKWSYMFSGVMILASIAILFLYPVRLGLDFTGGSLVEVRFTTSAPDSSAVRGILSTLEKAPAPAGILQGSAAPTEGEKLYDFSGAQVIQSENMGIILKLPQIDQPTYERLVTSLAELNGKQSVEKVRFETIGPTIGEGLKQNTWKALLLAVILMILYIAFAFRKVPKIASPWKFGVTAVIALVHDLFILVGFFALMGHLAGWEFDTLFVSAALTVFGFSVHDTIVVFDRIRENLILHGRQQSLEEIGDASINQTIARSINTSLSTIITLTALALVGAGTIRPFAVALVFGILIGTYSSIFVASSLLVDWQRTSAKREKGQA